jgi:Ni/Co efflux regulator RcnB
MDPAGLLIVLTTFSTSSGAIDSRPNLTIAQGVPYAQRDERREEERRGAPEPRREPPRVEARRPPPHFAQFRRGERLTPEYRHRNYVVTDWRSHHLHAPPAGYHWVGVGPDFLLVAIATGVISEVLANGQQVASPPPSAPPAPPPGASANVWYFCPPANTYYPYVNACPGGWQIVPASQPPTVGR